MNMQNVYYVKNPSMTGHFDTILQMNSEEKKFQDQIQVIQQAVAAKEIQFVKQQQTMQEKAKRTCQNLPRKRTSNCSQSLIVYNSKHVSKCVSLLSFFSYIYIYIYIYFPEVPGQGDYAVRVRERENNKNS